MNSFNGVGVVVSAPERKQAGQWNIGEVEVEFYCGKKKEPFTLKIEGFSEKADLISALQKGEMVAVSGEIRGRAWKNKFNTISKAFSISVSSIERFGGEIEEEPETHKEFSPYDDVDTGGSDGLPF